MNKLIQIALFSVALVGCADTPENRELIRKLQAIDRAFDPVSDNIWKEVDRMKESNRSNPVVTSPLPTQTTCTTKYNSVSNTYVTNCY